MPCARTFGAFQGVWVLSAFPGGMSFDSALEASVDLSFPIVPAGGAVGHHGLDVVILADRDQWLAVLASVHEDFLGPDSEVVDCWFL